MSKIVCVYHSIDLDGWMSAAVVKHWYLTRYKNCPIKNLDGEMEFDDPNTCLYMLGYNYGQPIPDLSQYDKVIMVDISFPKEEMIKLYQILAAKKEYLGETKEKQVDNFIWIDHHISAIKDMESYNYTIYGLRNVNYSACELTWMHLMEDAYMVNSYDYLDKNSIEFNDFHCSNHYMPEIVRLLGRYDSFQHKGIDEEQKVLEFQYGARQFISNYEDAYNYLHNCLLQVKPNIIENSIWLNGKSIYSYLCTEAKQTYKNGFEIQFYWAEPKDYGNLNNPKQCNAKFICINKERFNPINFGIDYHKDGYDGCACFHYANGVFNFSLYNDNGLVDCSVIAKQYGGGGHKGASGFRLDKEQFLKLTSNV